MDTSGRKLYFEDPLLAMTVGGRFFVRAGAMIGYGILVALMIAFLTSGMQTLQWLSLFLMFFLFDRFYHRGEADYSLSEISLKEQINIARYLSFSARISIEKALDRTILAGEDFHLGLLKNVFSLQDMRVALAHMDIGRHEIDAKLRDYFNESFGSDDTLSDTKNAIGRLVTAAFYEAVAEKSNYIKPHHLIVALAGLRTSEYANRLFYLFIPDPKRIGQAVRTLV